MAGLKARVMECTEKSFEGKKYYTLVVKGDDVPFGTVNDSEFHAVGSDVQVGFARNKEFKLVPRIVK